MYTPSPQIPRRDGFGAIVNADIPVGIDRLVDAVAKRLGWTLGIESTNRRGGYESHSLDVYGYDSDRDLVVVQLRRASRRREGWWQRVQKIYALIGQDDGQLFSHPLTASPRRIPQLDDMRPEDVVRWAESRIFGVSPKKLDGVIRQGDIALIPTRTIPAAAEPIAPDADGVTRATIRGSHEILVDGALMHTDDGVLYADGVVEVDHVPGQHAAIAAEGRFRIKAGERGESAWWADMELGDD